MAYGVVYSLHDPVTNELRYIGQTTLSPPSRRIDGHLDAAKRRRSHLSNWIRVLVAKGLCPVLVVVCEAFDQKDLDAIEIEKIASHRAAGYRLVNQADGGGGRKGVVAGPETREKIRQANLGKHDGEKNWWYRHDVVVDDVVSRWASGASISEIARDLDVSTRVIKMRLASVGESADGLIRREVSTDEIGRRWVSGQSQSEIVKALGVSRNLVIGRISRYKATHPEAAASRPHPLKGKPRPADVVAKVTALAQARARSAKGNG